MTNRLAARAFPSNYMHLNFPSKPTTVKLKIVLWFLYLVSFLRSLRNDNERLCEICNIVPLK